MSNFSTKIFGLAGAAMAFAGMAFGQATCTAGAPSTNIIRVEGTTEQIAPTVFNCVQTPGAPLSVAGTLSLQIFLSPALPITSKIVDTTTGKTEATATVTGGASVQGTVSGSTLQFAGLASPAGNFTVTITNVRVNATSLNVGSGIPPAISETAFLSGSTGTILPTALTFTNVAFAQAGLSPAKIYKSVSATTASTLGAVLVGSTGANSYVICNAFSPKADAYTGGALGGPAPATTPKSLAFIVQVNEGTVAAFKDKAAEGSLTPVTVGTVTNAVNSGTRIKVVFANVPANVTLLVPNTAIASAGADVATVTLTATETGALTAVSSSSTGNGAGLAAVTITGGTGQAVFEVTAADPNAFDQFNIPVFISTASNTVVGSSTAITATVSLAPTGSTNVPNFTSGASSTTLTASTFNLCTTSLLFPFVTNQLGFDTGLAIANTSSDPYGTTTQAGSCILSFYGAGAPTPASVTTANVPTGTVFTQVLSGVAAGFQGYIIAQCGFQYAHGFAFVSDGVGVNGGLAQGYLASVIPDVNQTGGRAASPLSAAGTGTGEVLGN